MSIRGHARVTDTDRGLARVAARIAGKLRVRVGILSGSDAPKKDHDGGDGGKASLLEVAAIHEFGAPAAGIPQRSFLRGGVDANEGEIRALQASQARRIVQGKVQPRIAMEQIGARVVGLLKKFIASNIPPPLKPETIARKGSSVALIDTGQLRSSITYQVTED